MSSALMLLRIETRRNLGLLIFPLVAAGIAYMAYAELPIGVELWPETALAIQGSIILVGPMAAGVGAWTAIRNKRRKIEELLATTPYSPSTRELTRWGATVFWFGIAYLLAAAVVLAFVFIGGAWGFPVLWPVLLGFFALTFNVTLGYVAGYYLPSFLTAPMVAIATYWLQGIAVYRAYGYPAQYLSPVPDVLDGSVFYGVLPHVLGKQSLLLLGLTGLGLMVVALKAGRRSAYSLAVVLAAAVLTASGAVMLLNTPADITSSMRNEASVPYDAECTNEQAVTVCVHPAYVKLLKRSATIINEVSASFAPLSGGPRKAEQAPTSDTTLKDGTLDFFLYDAGSLDSLAQDVAQALVYDNDQNNSGINGAQAVIMAWSLKKSGYEYRPALGFSNDTALTDAAERAMGRFEELDGTEQAAWLRKNYGELRQGNVELEDLP